MLLKARDSGLILRLASLIAFALILGFAAHAQEAGDAGAALNGDVGATTWCDLDARQQAMQTRRPSTTLARRTDVESAASDRMLLPRLKACTQE